MWRRASPWVHLCLSSIALEETLVLNDRSLHDWLGLCFLLLFFKFLQKPLVCNHRVLFVYSFLSVLLLCLLKLGLKGLNLNLQLLNHAILRFNCIQFLLPIDLVSKFFLELLRLALELVVLLMEQVNLLLQLFVFNYQLFLNGFVSLALLLLWLRFYRRYLRYWSGTEVLECLENHWSENFSLIRLLWRLSYDSVLML